jgi:hypothetical protein
MRMRLIKASETGSSNLNNAFLSLVVLSVVACSTKVDKSYSTDCEVDDDCGLMPLDDVCGGCSNVPIAMSDVEQAQADVEALQWQCIDIAECFNAWQPACDQGTCIAAPLALPDETDAGQ